jgi:hypothetical protein
MRRYLFPLGVLLEADGGTMNAMPRLDKCLRVCYAVGGAAKWARFFYLLLASAWLARAMLLPH